METLECDCGWTGTEAELINPFGVGRDRHMEGENCPECEENIFEEVEEVENLHS